MSGRPVVVVGDVGLDVITRPRGEIHWHSDTPSAVALVPGGAGGNSASWLAAAGADVTLLARIGHDAAGLACRSELEAEGVHCAFSVDETLPTCMVVILLDAHGDRTMFPDRGANKAFSVADVDLASLGLPDDPLPHLHLSGYVLFDTGSRAAGLEALRQARALGWTTSVDPQSPALIAREGVGTFLSWVDGVDLLLPNENEVATLGGLEAILRHTQQVVATFGAAGARWVADGLDVSAEAPHVANVDATGCGDAFNAGLLAAWLAGEAPADALAAGVAAGSAAAARVGARPR
ncbi:carbohydrate kinase family protein [Humibacillus xanthopallidus]|uniref:Sugar/nucleoside kinase (Ribokinase family) n=1 Tax=Humibacillus xanthopallidus TaxID=412689 RepID=A0A543I0F8_9MICO|nr:PfkB family carbohydrate kinase [Humibacillus xanthopallidus]TQM63965.1 sugar/nucleoside kinase (ribokinase family) [Humibacillus xanthopallidus]